MEQAQSTDGTDPAVPPVDPVSQNGGSTGDSVPAAIPWLQATAADLDNLDFEAPIAGSVSAACHELSEQYRRAVQLDAGAASSDTPETRIFTMLAAVTGMYLKAHDREEPFGPAMSSADGRRSAIPADFRGTPVDLLAEIASCAANPVLRARLGDVCWLLDRKRGNLGRLAVAAYVEIVEGAESGALKFASTSDWGGLEHGALDDLRRALFIGRAIGWEKPEVIRARDAVARLRQRAVDLRAAVPVAWFAGLDLDFRVSDPVGVAGGIEEALAAPVDADVHLVTSLWGLASRAYQLAKRDEDRYRCQSEAAEAFAAGAERVLAGQGKGSAMLVSHMMSNAIAQLHGIPAKRERRTELRHRLVDIQARIPEEMSVFSHHWDLKEIEAQVTKAMGDGALFDQLFLFAAIATSPDPAKLAKEAEESMRQHPLSSLVAAVHYDKEGKVVHRSEPAGLPGDPGDSAMRREIAQSESIRRSLAGASIEIARLALMAQHFLSEDMLAPIFLSSPFVPRELAGTFTRGFMRFFQGDFTSATYILTPLLENSLRHVLKSHGHDVSIFDDATQTQQYLTISKLFEQMRDELDAIFTRPITSDIENVFLNRPGPHLRHDIAHGLAHDGTPYGADAVYGGWLIFRLCLLPLFPHREQLRELIH